MERTVDVRGVTMKFSAPDEMIDSQLRPDEQGRCKFESLERETFDFLDQHLRDDDVFCNVGANFGIYVVYAALRRQLRKVIALEPEALNFAELCRNIQLNGIQRVSALCIGASDRDSFENYHLRAFVPGNHSGRTSRYLGGEGINAPSASNPFLEGYSQKIHLMPLDDLMLAARLPFLNVLLMDIDGGEINAVAGMSTTLRERSLRAAVIETGRGDDSAPIHRQMSANGFRCVRPKAGGRMNEFFVRD